MPARSGALQRWTEGLSDSSEQPAARFIHEGDVLLGLNGFETLTSANLQYLLDDSRIGTASTMKCQIYRRAVHHLKAR